MAGHFPYECEAGAFELACVQPAEYAARSEPGARCQARAFDSCQRATASGRSSVPQSTKALTTCLGCSACDCLNQPTKGALMKKLMSCTMIALLATSAVSMPPGQGRRSWHTGERGLAQAFKDKRRRRSSRSSSPATSQSRLSPTECTTLQEELEVMPKTEMKSFEPEPISKSPFRIRRPRS